MFSAPQKLKFTRFHKFKIKYSSTELNLFCPKFGDYGLQAVTPGKLTASQIEAGRLVIRRFSKKQAFLKIDVFPFSAFTSKPTSARMGKGKGKVAGWFCPIKVGRVLYEISSMTGNFGGKLPFTVFSLVNRKLPFKTKAIRLIY